MVALSSHPDLGWASYEGLAEQGTDPQGGNDGVYNAVAGGEQMFGMVVDHLRIRDIANGAPMGFVFPEESVSAVTEPLAILSTAQDVAAARAFVDFLIAPEGQQRAADMGYLHAHPARHRAGPSSDRGRDGRGRGMGHADAADFPATGRTRGGGTGHPDVSDRP